MTTDSQTAYDTIKADLDAGRTLDALSKLRRAVAAGTDDQFFLYALGNCLFKTGDYEESAAALSASVRLNPQRAEAFNDLSAALFVLGRDAEALTCLRRALDLRPGLPEAEETDALWLLRYGRFQEGWRKYEARYATEANKRLRRAFQQPRWQGEALNGRTILLHAEQGFGDALQFLRYAPLVAARGGRVILEVYPGIPPLLTGMPGIAQIVTTGEPLPPFDLQCSLMSLPLAFKTDFDSIPATMPYLSVPDDYLSRWRRTLGPRRGMRIGIAWSGNPQHRDDARRSIPFDTFSALLADRAGVEFHILQNQIRDSDRPALTRFPHVRDHTAILKDFGDAGALVSLMDLVISVDTSVAHLAGALDRPAWILLAHLADWRWLLERDDSPWYPSFWVLRQPERGDWNSVLAEAGVRLTETLA